MAHVEIFILNYNGARFLDRCLSSLQVIERGLHSFTVSVVDNNSSDNSEEIVANFPGVNFIKLERNFGFSEGNNRGVWARLAALRAERREADVVCFLNNDTKVEPLWLSAAMERFAHDERIGVVASKSVFYDKMIEVSLSSIAAQDDSCTSDCSVLMALDRLSQNIHSDPRRSRWIECHQIPGSEERFLRDRSRVLVAVEDPNAPTTLFFRLRVAEPVKYPLTVSLRVGARIVERVVSSDAPQLVTIDVSPSEYRDVVQNAGSYVTPDWDGGDVGMYEIDRQQYDTAREVAAVCGVSMFMRRELFERLRGFDNEYFAYFEDTDLSLRARLKGYLCWYEPRSVLRHVHCGSAGEFSPYYNFNVTHSHLLFTSRWMQSGKFIKKFLKVLRSAYRELKLFEVDQDLESKPNLRTFARFLKHPLRIPRNRLFHAMRWRAIRRLPGGRRSEAPPLNQQPTGVASADSQIDVGDVQVVV